MPLPGRVVRLARACVAFGLVAVVALTDPACAGDMDRLPFLEDKEPDSDSPPMFEPGPDDPWDPEDLDAPYLWDDPSILGAAPLVEPISAFTCSLLGAETGREIWTGADVSVHTWVLFSGFTYAPLGGIFDNGPRVRLMGGYGGYSYERKTSLGTTEHMVGKVYIDLLAGYQHRIGPLTGKLFAGLSHISHDVAPLDGLTPVSGSDAGIKTMIELWLNIGSKAWSSLDAAWAKPFNTSSLRSRLGYRVRPRLSAGLEGGLNIDEGDLCRLPDETPAACDMSPKLETATALVQSGRGGLFARMDWMTGETSLSVGVIGTGGDAGDSFRPYATLQWLSQF